MTSESQPAFGCTSQPCESIMAGQMPDMRMGDTCLMCLCRECERCEKSIDIDEENQIVHPHGAGWGYIDVCDKCLRPDDRKYDD